MSRPPPTYVTINGFPIDCSISETHVFDAEVTDHPVEKGADVADNVRSKPIVVTINGLVSDTPLTDIQALRATETLDDFGGPSGAALAWLEAIRDVGEPITITTAVKSYDSMVLQSLTIPRDAKTGMALRFTAVFKQVIIVTNNQAFVLVSNPTLGNKAHRGNKPSTPDTGGYYAIKSSLLGGIVDQAGVKDKITPQALGATIGTPPLKPR